MNSQTSGNGLFTTEQLAQKIQSTPLLTEPFDHINFEDVFPSAFYKEILAHLPANEFYEELKHPDALQPDGTSARLCLKLLDENINRLPAAQKEFWSKFTKEMLGSDVQCAFKKKFQNALEKRNGGLKLENIKIRPNGFLMRDLRGYKIDIHPDTPSKAVTTQFYLPSDESMAHLGTTFYAGPKGGEITEAKTLKFRPNTGYAFTVTDTSWHGVKQMSGADRIRNSLMIIYYYDTGAPSQGY